MVERRLAAFRILDILSSQVHSKTIGLTLVYREEKEAGLRFRFWLTRSYHFEIIHQSAGIR
jgi:hypothetical protein